MTRPGQRPTCNHVVVAEIETDAFGTSSGEVSSPGPSGAMAR